MPLSLAIAPVVAESNRILTLGKNEDMEQQELKAWKSIGIMKHQKILYIELCNFTDYPLGGHLSFAKHLTRAMQGTMNLVGLSTDTIPTGIWMKREVEGYEYNYYNTAVVEKTSKRPLIPSRITNYFLIKRHIGKLPLESYETIIVQTPEVLLAIPQRFLPKVCLVMPGVENPLSIARYKFARNFQGLYDRVFFARAQRVKCLLAAADNASIQTFILRSKGMLQSDKVFQFPTRYDASIFKTRDKLETRLANGVAADECMLVTTGRLNWFKGWKLMIDAFTLFRQNHPRSRLYFIGDGEDREKIESEIKEHGLQDSVKLLGMQPLQVVSAYLSMADLFVMGSFKEGWSTSLVEAVACGTPCVVTDFSSAREMVQQGVNGYVVEGRNPKEFAQRMCDALELDRQQIEQCAEASMRYSVQNMRGELEKILSKVDAND